MRCWRQRRREGSGGAGGLDHHHPPGRATLWHRFDPSQGLGRLRDLIAAVAPGEGVELTDDVGVASHAGDLLCRVVIPSRLATPPRALR